MSGTYFNPLHRVFLNLSGGTVTGNTLFTQSVSAATFYSGSTNLSDIFAFGATASLNPTYVGYGSSSSGLTGISTLSFVDNIGGNYTRGYLNVFGVTIGNIGGAQLVRTDQLKGNTNSNLEIESVGSGSINFYTNAGTLRGSIQNDGTSRFNTLSATTFTANTVFIPGINTAYNFRHGGLLMGFDSTGTYLWRADQPYENSVTSFATYFGGPTYSQRFKSDSANFGSTTQNSVNSSAYVSIAGSVSSRASISIESGVTVSTPLDGDIWNDGVHLYGKIGGNVKILEEFLRPTMIGFGSSASGITSDPLLYFDNSNPLTTGLYSNYAFIGRDSSGNIVDLSGYGFAQVKNGTTVLVLDRASDTYGYFSVSVSGEIFRASFSGASIMISGRATANLDIASASTSQASLRIRSGATVSSPNDGDIWNDGQHLYGKFGGEIKQLDASGSTSSGTGTTFLPTQLIAFGSSTSGVGYASDFRYASNSKLLAIDGYLYIGSMASGIAGIQSVQPTLGLYGQNSYSTIFLNNDSTIQYNGSAGHLFNGGIVGLSALTATTNISLKTVSSEYGLDYYNAGVKRWSINVDGNNYFRFHPWQSGNYGSNDIFLEGSAVGIGGFPTENLTVYGASRTNTLTATTITASTIIAAYERVEVLTATTVSAYTIQSDSLRGLTDRVVQADSGGTLSAAQEIVSGIVTDPTAITLLTTASNWDYSGVYTGTTITNTYQGQFYGDTGNTYIYLALADNYFARIPRV